MIGSRILIVEDDADQARILKGALEGLGHQVLGPAPDCSSALELIWRERPDLAFIDTHLGSETCEAVLDECDQQDVRVVVTLLDGVDLPGFCGARESLAAPFSEGALESMLVRPMSF